MASDRDARPSGTGLVGESDLAVAARAGGRHLSMRAQARGLAGAGVAIVVGLVLELVGLNHTNPQHFLLMTITAFTAGVVLGSAVMLMRAKDALEEKELYRSELNRVAARKAELESARIQHRESSVPPRHLAENEDNKGRS